jgi:prepilin-type N-terminal cleavage/methylation domain-containing protein
MSARRGYTIVEVMVGLMIMALLMVMIMTFFSSGTSQSTKGADSSDAVRSVMIASEFMRYDIARMRLVDPSKDLAIFKDGRALSVRVPREMTPDFWYYTWDPVTYELAPPVDSNENPPRYQMLYRTDEHGRKPLANCYLKDMLVKIVPIKEVSAMQAYLEITLVGIGNPTSSTMYTQAQLLPLTLWAPPTKYEVPNH